jgi:hypothetical protein
MITCRDFVEQLGDLVGGHTPGEVTAVLRHHLDGCPACRAYLDSYRLAVHLGGQLPRLPLPARLARRLRAILEEELGE